jgi:hypothetical protein
MVGSGVTQMRAVLEGAIAEIVLALASQQVDRPRTDGVHLHSHIGPSWPRVGEERRVIIKAFKSTYP